MPVFCLFTLGRHGNFTAGVTLEHPYLLCTALALNIVVDYYRVCRFIDVKSIFLSICDVKMFLTFTFTEYGTVLTTIIPILFLYLNTVIVTAGAFEP